MKHTIQHWIPVSLLSAAVGCSLLNRDGPEVTCAELQWGKINACKDGIIASCVDQHALAYEVCDESERCSDTWQVEGRFRCNQTDPVPDGLVGADNSAGSGGTSGGSAGSNNSGGSTGTSGAPGGCTSSAPCMIVSGTRGINDVALDDSNVYFTDSESLQSVAKTGGFPSVMASGASFGSVAVRDGFVYAEQDSAIHRIAIKGGTPQLVATSPMYWMGAFAVDDLYVYWFGGFSLIEGSGLWRSPKEGGDQELLVKRDYVKDGDAFVLRGGFLYWNTFNGYQQDSIWRIPTSGPFPTTPTTIPVQQPFAHIDVAPTAVFGATDSSIFAIPFDGSGPVLLVDEQSWVSAIFVDEQSVYWDSQSHTGREIRKAPLSGGADPVAVAISADAASKILVDSSEVYWVEGTNIFKAPK